VESAGFAGIAGIAVGICGVQICVPFDGQLPSMAFRDTAGRHISRCSKRPQEGRQATIPDPLVALSANSANITFRERAGLHLQVDLGVDFGCVDRDMLQPRSNRVDVDTGK